MFMAMSSHKSHVHRINYVYIPVGNKSMALYWVAAKWIPKLLAEGVRL